MSAEKPSDAKSVAVALDIILNRRSPEVAAQLIRDFAADAVAAERDECFAAVKANGERLLRDRPRAQKLDIVNVALMAIRARSKP